MPYSGPMPPLAVNVSAATLAMQPEVSAQDEGI
jgi:hypothetical protein